MAYDIELVRQDQQHTSIWNGGTTTEIAIHPKNAVYSRRDFVWRISSACVESEESEFTILPGICRLIMVLEGNLTLEHEHHHSVRLEPFQQDAFAGDWMTRSRGRARDFNIMLSGSCTGQMQVVSVQGRSSLAVPGELVQKCDKGKKAVRIIYSVDGTIVASVGIGETWTVDAGDALLVTSDHQGAARNVKLFNQDNIPVYAVLATIWYEDASRQEPYAHP